MELLIEYMNKGIIVMLSITMPCICTAAAIGLIVGILQAVTQVQEQTIAAAPKVLGVFLVLLLGSFGFVKLLNDIFLEGTELAFNVIPKQENFALSSNYYHYTKPFSEEMKDTIVPSNGKTKKIMNKSSSVPFSDKSEKVKHYSSDRSEMPSPSYLEQKSIRGN